MKAAFLLVLCYLAGTNAFKCIEGPRLSGISQIDCGNGKVVASVKYGRGYYLQPYGWSSLGSQRIKHASVGNAGTYAVDTRNSVYKLVGGKLAAPTQAVRLSQVDAGGDNHVVGANNLGYCFRRSLAMSWIGGGRSSWTRLNIAFRYVSCGMNNICCGIDTRSRTYCTKRVDPNSCRNWGWSLIKATPMKMIEVSADGRVFAVSLRGDLFERIGVTSRRPQGIRWVSIKMCMPVRHVCYDLRTLWAVTNAGFLLKCVH